MNIQQICKLRVIQSRLCLPVTILIRERRGSGKSSGKGNVCSEYMPKEEARPSIKRFSPCGGQHSAGPCGRPPSGGEPPCGGAAAGPAGGGTTTPALPEIKRALTTGKCRMGFIPEEWFLFFNNKTGVTGPYLLMIGIANYLASKEIFVMEHEYYSGLSIVLVLYLVTTKFGDKIGAALDKLVDEVHASFQNGRNKEIEDLETSIKEADLAQKRAQGQKELMAAKKENIALQYEAVYRERLMMVYRAVRGRMEYHIRRYRKERLIHQRWMVEWIIKKVQESITPEFRKKALQSAITELEAMASRPKKS